MGATRPASGIFQQPRPAFIGKGTKKDMHFYPNTVQSLLLSG